MFSAISLSINLLLKDPPSKLDWLRVLQLLLIRVSVVQEAFVDDRVTRDADACFFLLPLLESLLMHLDYLVGQNLS